MRRWTKRCCPLSRNAIADQTAPPMYRQRVDASAYGKLCGSPAKTVGGLLAVQILGLDRIQQVSADPRCRAVRGAVGAVSVDTLCRAPLGAVTVFGIEANAEL